jgi:hypothetical protein
MNDLLPAGQRAAGDVGHFFFEGHLAQKLLYTRITGRFRIPSIRLYRRCTGGSKKRAQNHRNGDHQTFVFIFSNCVSNVHFSTPCAIRGPSVCATTSAVFSDMSAFFVFGEKD